MVLSEFGIDNLADILISGLKRRGGYELGHSAKDALVDRRLHYTDHIDLSVKHTPRPLCI